MNDPERATRVLLVEDSRTQAEALRADLEGAGYEVTTAPSGEHGVVAFDREPFDIVISDIVMPGSIDGYELCRHIKASIRRQTPVVLLTSLADPLDIINGLECGADNFLTKPYHAQHLLARLQQLLATREARADGRLTVGVGVLFLGKRFTISADREQILDLLITTFEDAVLQNQELRRRERELQAARAELARYAGSIEARMADILNLAEDAIISVDHDRRIIVFNRGAETIFGYVADELLGEFLDLLLSSSLIDAIPQRIGLDATEEEPSRRSSGRDDVTGRRKNGTEFPAEASVSKLTQNGETIFTLIVRDVTERRKVEQHLRQSQKMEAVGQLAGGIAHDFNNMLTAITGYADLLIAGFEESDARLDDVKEIRIAADRATALTRQLLAFSRRQLLEPRVLDLNITVAGIDKMLRRIVGDDVQLKASLAPSLGRARADPGQMEQVILNLVVNARDAMPRGGQVTIETANVELDAAYAREHTSVRPGRYVMLAVSDTGIGMDAETRGKIFEPFFTTKAQGQGTGLGLATVYGIVKQSDGNIWVYSEPGHGTTFKVFLPRVDALVESAPVVVKDAITLEGTETILVVEDDESVRRIICKVLREHWYTVLEAAAPSAALTLANQHGGDVSLLLTDVVMPGMRGPELSSLIGKIHPGLQVLYTSGYSDEAIVNHGVLEAGAAFLQKPFTPEALLRKVRMILDRS